jgi:hypothetical protein
MQKPKALRGVFGSMSGISAGAARAIAARFSWSHHKTFADIGAAQGMVPATLAIAHPHLRGIGFDLPQVQPVFEEFVAGLGPSDRVQFQKGNFFEEELPRTDVIENGARSAQFGDLARKRILLAKAFDALPRGGAVVIYDTIIGDNRRDNAFGLLMSLNMLIETTEGFDYTGADCSAWMHEAGCFRNRRRPRRAAGYRR